MKLVTNDHCTGCTACLNICPKKCIKFESDNDGFAVPVIDSEKCIDCGICSKTCPINHKPTVNNPMHSYAMINLNDTDRANSSSGGIFTLLAQYVLQKNGAVYGAAFDEKMAVKHIRITDENDIIKLQGSKYVQSELNTVFSDVKRDIKSDIPVIFVGTPCQIGGLVKFLGTIPENLLLVDFICHGVPSPKVWKNYVEYREKAVKSDVKKASFRDKVSGWKNYSVSLEFQNNQKYISTVTDDIYMKIFLSHIALRNSCYHCKFKSKNRISDITLGDFWGIEKIYPELNDDRGTSLVVINSQKGNSVFESIKSQVIFKEIDIDAAISFNRSMTESAAYNKHRKAFFRNINRYDAETSYYLAIKQSIFHKAIKSIINIVKGKLK